MGTPNNFALVVGKWRLWWSLNQSITQWLPVKCTLINARVGPQLYGQTVDQTRTAIYFNTKGLYTDEVSMALTGQFNQRKIF